MTEKIEINNKKTIFNLIFFSLMIITIFLILYLTLFIALFDNSFSRLFKGSDFKLFTNGSQLILDGNKEKLYDTSYYEKLLLENEPDKVYRPHYTPLLYYFYVPFALLPYFWSILLSSILFIILYIISIIIIIQTYKRLENFKY